MTGYHRNAKGLIKPCTADKRACRFLDLAPHYTQEQYDHMVETGNPLVEVVPAKYQEFDYFVSARERYENAIALNMAIKKHNLERKTLDENLKTQYHMENVNPKDLPIPGAREKELQNQLRDFYVTKLISHGFSESEIGVYIEEGYPNNLEGETPIKGVPSELNTLIRDYNTYLQIARDPIAHDYRDIKADLKNNRLPKPERYVLERKKELDALEQKYTQEYTGFSYRKYHKEVLRKAEEDFITSARRAKGGVTSGAENIGLKNIPIASIKIDAKGKIMNLWYDNSKIIEPIVTWEDNGNSSAFVTKSGHRISAQFQSPGRLGQASFDASKDEVIVKSYGWDTPSFDFSTKPKKHKPNLFEKEWDQQAGEKNTTPPKLPKTQSDELF